MLGRVGDPACTSSSPGEETGDLVVDKGAPSLSIDNSSIVS
jgi:hypothetical protein